MRALWIWFLAGVVLEILLYVTPAWRVRRYVVVLPLLLVAMGSVVTGLQLLNEWAALFWLAGSFRVLNYLRIAQGRMHERYLRRTAQRTGLVICVAQAGLLWLAPSGPRLLEMTVWLAGLQVVVATGILAITLRTIKKASYRPPALHVADRDLPSVTVAIPARNATPDMEACLHSVLVSDYPKLEVIVLDDASQDNTPDIIRSFAHDGVRFIKGEPPQERWLAKNQAYDRLADEANGSYVLFCGVDVRMGPDTIRSLVMTLLDRKKDMVSVLPRRLSSDPHSAFIQPLRYWWELALPRRIFNRPPVLSTLWIIKRDRLKQLGGFEAVQHAIIPEGYFAREVIKQDAYSFVRAGKDLDVRTEKSWRDQYDTAIRTRYPQIHRRPELALVLTVIDIVLLLAPFATVIVGVWTGFGLTEVLALVAGIALTITHAAIVQVSDPANTSIAVLTFPIAIVIEMILGYASMLRYEFGSVVWKGRNVTGPVMHVIPRLPKLN